VTQPSLPRQALRCSVIIPACNAAATLDPCLAALSQGSLPRDQYQVIVVDDASTDRTVEIARQQGAVVVALAERSGPAAARNAGAAAAEAGILLFTDADCQPAPDWCQEMLRPFADPAVAAAYGVYRSRQTEAVARFAQAEFEERYAHLAGRERIDFFATHAAAVRREVLLNAGGFRTDLRGNEDVELAFRLERSGCRIVFAPNAAVYHKHPATLSAYLSTKVSRGYWRTMTYARHPPKAVADAYTPPWLKWQVALLAAAGGLAVLAAWRAVLIPLLLLCLAGLALTLVPFLRFVRRSCPDLVPLAPWLSLARSAALGLGVIVGLAALVGAALLGRR